MSIFYNDRVIFAVMNQYVSHAVLTNTVFFYISEIEQEKGVRWHNSKIDRSEERHYPKGLDQKEFDIVFAGYGCIDRNVGNLLL
jgi:hypothetical protein